MPHVNVSMGPCIAVFSPTGTFTVEDVIQLIGEHYPRVEGRSILWDLTAANMVPLTDQDYLAIAVAAKKNLPVGVKRLTAFAISDQGDYLRMCKYFEKVRQEGIPAEHAVFHSVELANRWLNGTAQI